MWFGSGNEIFWYCFYWYIVDIEFVVYGCVIGSDWYYYFSNVFFICKWWCLEIV